MAPGTTIWVTIGAKACKNESSPLMSKKPAPIMIKGEGMGTMTLSMMRPRPPSWWKFVSSVSMPEKFLPQLPYNERSQSDQGLGIPLKQPSTASLVLDLSIHRFVAGGSDH